MDRREGADAGIVVAQATAEVPRADAGAADTADEVLRSIRFVSPTERAIPRRSLDRIFEDLPLFMKTARVMPEIVNGRPTGIRVFGVRADDLLGRLGLENGDRIERIGGRPIDTPESALEAYAALRGASSVDIDIVRRGTPLRMFLRIE